MDNIIWFLKLVKTCELVLRWHKDLTFQIQSNQTKTFELIIIAPNQMPLTDCASDFAKS